MHEFAALAVSALALLSLGCAPAEEPPACGDVTAESAQPTLREKYEHCFAIGAAVDFQSYQTHADLLVPHFSSVTHENEMKFSSLQRTPGNFSWLTADRIVEFAEQNDMEIRGHALVWHRQNPSWLFVDDAGEPATPEVVLDRMRTHIQAVMTRYRGRIRSWDVVNEAIMNDGAYRSAHEAEEDQRSPWAGIVGERYIAEAFRAAHAADPEAKLFYNDYYNYLPDKQQAIYAMLKQLLDEGVPVHGVGLQCHLNIAPSADPEHQSFHQSVENLERAIELYASLGLEIQITEMDISLYVGGQTYTEDQFYTEATFTEDLERQQAERYRAFFEMFRRHADVITSVTFWGIADDNTWLSEFDSGRTDFPLLFDVAHQPKLAYDAIMQF